MLINLTWSIAQLDLYPEHDGKIDVVFNAHWRLDATDGTHHGSAYGSDTITLDSDAEFVPFADLTESQVIDWVKAALGEERVAELEAHVTNEIARQANPPVISPPLPWA